MQRLRYKTKIRASKQKVWDTMLNLDTYKQWTKAFSQNSSFTGNWTQGSHMVFTDPEMGGTKALLEEVRPYELVRARHVAVIGKDGSEDTQSDMAKKWIGSTEQYKLRETNGVTELIVDIETNEEFAEMFSSSWPRALEQLKNLCEGAPEEVTSSWGSDAYRRA